MKVYSLQDIQRRLFEMSVVIRDALEKNNFKYMIAYGTLLGAVRHKGVIPWDDDFDFYLFDDEYDAAIECLRNELPDDMFVEDEKSEPLFFHGWARVKDLNTMTTYKCYPQDSCYAHKGLNVDLYRAKFCKQSELYIQKANEYQLYIDRRLKKDLITQEEYDRRQEDIAKMRKKISSGSKLIMSNLISDYGFYYDDIFPLKKYKFSDELFYGPSNSDAVFG